MRLLYITLSVLIFTSCSYDRNVCPKNIHSHIVLMPFKEIKDTNNKFKFGMINSNNKFIDVYQFQSSSYVIPDNNVNRSKKYIDFSYENLPSDKVYKFIDNENIYFIYDINLANTRHARDCGIETTYKVNSCISNGYSIYINPSCAISKNQEQDYFKKNVKPYFERVKNNDL